jgi:phage tail sheath gpL-like
MAYDEGGAGVAANQTITLVGNATGAGTLTAVIGGRTFRAGVANADTITEMGDALVAKINAAANAPFTAANAAGTVTVTARTKGTHGNSIAIRCSITSGITTTATAGGATFASGATNGDPTTQLANIESQRFHHIAFHQSDSTNAALVKTHIDAVSTALNQKWGTMVVGFTGTNANAQTLAAALDSYRCQVAWHQTSDQSEFELAACLAALRAKTVDRKSPLNLQELKGITAQNDETKWPTESDESSAIQNGVTPIRALRNGKAYVVRSVHARTTTPRFLDTAVVEISDYIDEDFIEQARARYGNAALKRISEATTPNVVTKERIQQLLEERMLMWDKDLDYIDGAQTDIDNGDVVAELNATDTNRIDVGYPFRAVQNAVVIAVMKTYTTSIE